MLDYSQVWDIFQDDSSLHLISSDSKYWL